MSRKKRHESENNFNAHGWREAYLLPTTCRLVTGRASNAPTMSALSSVTLLFIIVFECRLSKQFG